MNGELLEKILCARKKYKLVGEQLYSDDEYKQMVSATRDFYNSHENNEDLNYRLIIFSTLVEIGKRWKPVDNDGDDKDSGYWDFVYNVLNISNSTKAYPFFTGIIRSLNGVVAVADTHNWYWATVLMHGLAPSKSLFSAFDFCYSIYKDDFDFSYTQTNEPTLKSISEQFAKILRNDNSNENEGISIGSKIYSIRIGLRSLILHKEIGGEFFRLFKQAIEIIDKYFHQGVQYLDVEEKYFEKQISLWWGKKIAEIPEDRKSSREYSNAVNKQSISARFISRDSQVFLCIPPIRLEKDDAMAWATVYVGEEQVISKEIPFRLTEFTRTTKYCEFPLNKLLTSAIDIRVEITAGEKQIYDSKSSLKRQFILFRNEKEILKTINEPSNYFIYTLDIDEIAKQISSPPSTCGKNLYNIYPKNGERIEGRDKTFIFSDEKKLSDIDLYFAGRLNDISWLKDDKSYMVYNKIPKLVISKNTSLSGLEILKDDKRSALLTDMVKEEVDDNFFVIDLKDLLNDGSYSEIKIYSHKEENFLCKQNIVVFQNIKTSFNKSYFYGDSEMRFTVSYRDFKEHKDFTRNDEAVVMDFNGGYLSSIIPWVKWRIDNGEWHNNTNLETQWYKNAIKDYSILEFDAPGQFISDFKLGIIVFNGTEREKIIVDSINGKYQIGRTIFNVIGKDNLYIVGNKPKPRELFEICPFSTKEHFVCCPLVYKDNKTLWCPEGNFIGDQDTQFSTKLISSSKDIDIEDLTTENKDISDSIPSDVYMLEIKSKSKNIFRRKENLLYKEEFIVGEPEFFRFKNKAIKITAVMYGNEPPDKWERLKTGYYIDQLQYIASNDGRAYYSGCLYYVDNHGAKKYLDYMKNSHDTDEKINPVRIELRTSNSFWLVAGYVQNDDFLGDLFFDERSKEICNLDSLENKNIMTIDWCYFEEENNV